MEDQGKSRLLTGMGIAAALGAMASWTIAWFKE
jgi:hypothetical protein